MYRSVTFWLLYTTSFLTQTRKTIVGADPLEESGGAVTARDRQVARQGPTVTSPNSTSPPNRHHPGTSVEGVQNGLAGFQNGVVKCTSNRSGFPAVALLSAAMARKS